jgi:hypothetical protein
MNPITALYAAILFVLLTPGVLLRIPSKGSLLTSSIIHAIVFGILLYFISKIVHQYKYGVENFENSECDKIQIDKKRLFTNLDIVKNNLEQLKENTMAREERHPKLYAALNIIDEMHDRYLPCNQ